MTKSDAYHFLGIDGGGTGCRAAICDAFGKRMGEATGGPANFSTNPEQAISNVRSAIEQAARIASLPPRYERNCIAHVGLAGIMSDADADRMASALPLHHVRVSDDRATSIVGALGKNDGALVAIGTGSFIAARHGSSYRYFGGWGLRIGDQASGAWLGRAVLELCLLVNDGIEVDSDLTRQVLLQFSDDPVELFKFASRALPHDFAAFAPTVVEAAKAGDRNGSAIMQRGAEYVNACLKVARPSEGDVICLTGGVGPHYKDYLDQSFRELVRAPEGSALDGALMLARQYRNRLDTSE